MNDNEKNVNYYISWTQTMKPWEPLQQIFPEAYEPQEPEITDFTEAQAVLAKIMTKFDK